MCSTQLYLTEDNHLRIVCTMNCLEVGTVGGGTILGPQHAMLKVFQNFESQTFSNLDAWMRRLKQTKTRRQCQTPGSNNLCNRCSRRTFPTGSSMFQRFSSKPHEVQPFLDFYSKTRDLYRKQIV